MRPFAVVSALLLMLVVVPPLVVHGQLDALVDAAGSGGLDLASILPRPFGGRILLIRPCFNFSALHIILGPPSPGAYIYQTGVSRTYLSGPPIHPGQWLLGMAATDGICDIDPGKFFDAQGGRMILFHGSSL